LRFINSEDQEFTAKPTDINRLIPWILGFCVLSGCYGQEPELICRVLVAASARDATQKSVDAFRRSKNPSERSKIVVVSGPSNGLSQQIMSGAPADIFISANPKWTDAIEAQSELAQEFMGNQLVLATHHLNNETIVAAESVPLGDYAKQVIGQSTQLQNALTPKLVFAKDSTALVAWLENRETDFGFVYASDLNRSTSLTQALAIDPACHDPITYSIALLKNEKRDSSKLREQVYDWLRSEASMRIYERAGFVPMSEKPPMVSKPIE
jgi:molybdate transport system substrate-binding protein